MPELPEVETVKRTLENRVKDKVIEAVEVLSYRAVRPRSPEEFSAELTGEQILGLDRRGKYLIFALGSGALLIVHLRMTGRLTIVDAQEPMAKHTAVVITLSDGNQLRFIDQRKFGVMELIGGEVRPSAGYRTLGPEPLDAGFTVEYLARILANRTAKIKSLLLDQRIIAGLGNIYADEALFRARIHPTRSGGSLSVDEVEQLHRAIRNVIRLGIEHRGTTIRDYVDSFGDSGQFQHLLKAYGKEGEPCPECGHPMARVKVGGRSSFHCPKCQV